MADRYRYHVDEPIEATSGATAISWFIAKDGDATRTEKMHLTGAGILTVAGLGVLGGASGVTFNNSITAATIVNGIVTAASSSAADLVTHHTRHESGGADAIKLDDLATPNDNTDLNATTTEHGLLRKLDNNPSHYLDGQGNWAALLSHTFEDVLGSDQTFDGGTTDNTLYDLSGLTFDLDIDGEWLIIANFYMYFYAGGTASARGAISFNGSDLPAEAIFSNSTAGSTDTAVLTTTAIVTVTSQPKTVQARGARALGGFVKFLATHTTLRAVYLGA